MGLLYAMAVSPLNPMIDVAAEWSEEHPKATTSLCILAQVSETSNASVPRRPEWATRRLCPKLLAEANGLQLGSSITGLPTYLTLRMG